MKILKNIQNLNFLFKYSKYNIYISKYEKTQNIKQSPKSTGAFDQMDWCIRQN